MRIEGSLTGRQVQIFPTEMCNLKCGGCPYPMLPQEKQRALKQKELPPEKWFTIIDYLYNQGNGLFCIMGGEPASYTGIGQVIEHITENPDAFVLFSTSGIHLLRNQRLRESVGNALAQPQGRGFKNGIAISFDTILSSSKNPVNSREFKAVQGLAFVELMQQKYGDQITYVANVMVTPDNLPKVPDMQAFLEANGIFTNLCTQQVKCFGGTEAVFNSSHLPGLTEVAVEMIRRKIKGGLVVNSVNYLSQFPGIIGMEKYKCWEESTGSPVIDIGPDGTARYCNWIGQNLEGGPPGIPISALMNGTVSWDKYCAQSKETTRMLCTSCSWSRGDRTPDMVRFNENIRGELNIPHFDPYDPRLQNHWAQAQMSIN